MYRPWESFFTSSTLWNTWAGKSKKDFAEVDNGTSVTLRITSWLSCTGSAQQGDVFFHSLGPGLSIKFGHWFVQHLIATANSMTYKSRVKSFESSICSRLAIYSLKSFREVICKTLYSSPACHCFVESRYCASCRSIVSISSTVINLWSFTTFLPPESRLVAVDKMKCCCEVYNMIHRFNLHA